MNQLTAVKTRYPLTYFTWPYRGLRCRPIEVEYFLEVIRWQVTSFQMIADSSLFISNSLPTNVDICSSVIITWSVCYSACAKVLCFTLTNKHGPWTEADVLSSTAFCGRILSAPRKKKWNQNAKQTGICMMLRLLKWIRRQNSWKCISWIQSRIRWMAWLR